MSLINTYKKRFYFLVFGAFIFAVLCYHLAFKKTLNEYRNLKGNKYQLELLEEAPIQLQLLENKLKNTKEEINSNTHSSKNYQVNILSISTSIMNSNRIKITDFPDLSSEITDGITVLTQQMTLQGSFIELLKFLDIICKDRTIGRLSSADFYYQKDVRTGLSALRMKLYFQLIEQNKENE